MHAKADELIAYHGPIAQALTIERTSYRSQLIPVTPYILVACAESFLRYPEMMKAIDAARPAGDIGLTGHRPGSNVNSVYLWSIANFWLLGRKILTTADPSLDDAFTVMDFWERAAMAFRRQDGTRQAWDAGGIVRPYGNDVLAPLVEGVVPVETDALRTQIKKFNATLVNYLFLLYFDTRVGSGDTGPYPLPDGRVLLVRDFYRMSQSDFWWSDVAREVPYHNLTAALVLDGVDLRVTDFGTAVTTPEDYLDRLVGFSLYTTDTPQRSLELVPLGELDDIVAVVRDANRQHYRNIAAMSRDEMIRCGAYVYFTFLRPFADAAGVAGDLDWSVPSALNDQMYELLAAFDDEAAPTPDPDAEYYAPLSVP